MRIERDIWQTLAVIGGLLVLFAVALWLPLHLKQNRLRAQLADAERQLALDREGTQGMEALQAEVDELQREVNGAQKYVPTEGETAALLRQISTDLETLQVSDREMQTQAVVHGHNFSVIPLTLRFTGSYRALYDFLDRVESNRRLIRVVRLELDSAVERVGEPVQVRLDLMTFFSKPERAGVKQE